jgi:hypothetical protein
MLGNKIQDAFISFGGPQPGADRNPSWSSDRLHIAPWAQLAGGHKHILPTRSDNNRLSTTGQQNHQQFSTRGRRAGHRRPYTLFDVTRADDDAERSDEEEWRA